MRTRALLRVFSLALACSAAASAQNLLANPEFDDLVSLDPWFVNATGSWVVGPDARTCVLSGSAAGTSALAGGGEQYLSMLSECIAIDPVATPTLWLRTLYQTNANVFARLYLGFYTDGGCVSPSGYSGFVAAGTSATWRSLLGSVAVPSTIHSVRLWVDFNPAVSGIPQYSAAVDQVYVGPDALLFADGVEADAGSACRWSLGQNVNP